MGLTGFRGRLVALAVAVTTLAVCVLVVVSSVLLSRTTEADAYTLAHSRAQAIASRVTVQRGSVVLVEAGNEVLDSVAWVYVDGRLIDGIVPAGLAPTLAPLSRADRVLNVTSRGYLLRAEPLAIAGCTRCYRSSVTLTCE